MVYEDIPRLYSAIAEWGGVHAMLSDLSAAVQ